jgi:hypothetical protein
MVRTKEHFAISRIEIANHYFTSADAARQDEAETSAFEKRKRAATIIKAGIARVREIVQEAPLTPESSGGDYTPLVLEALEALDASDASLCALFPFIFER